MREYDDLEDLRAAGYALVDEAIRHLDRPDSAPVETMLTPPELARWFGPPPAEGRPWRDVLLDLSTKVVDESNRLAHPMYMGQQVCPPLPLPALADAVVSMLNQSQAVWEMSPASTMLEHQLVRWFASQAFGQVGAQTALGTFVSGGTAGNLTALLAARARAFPSSWSVGIPPGALLITGRQAHYSVARTGGILGLGANNVVSVGTNDRHATDPDAVEAALEAAEITRRPVLAVVATAGSTATGSFDDLNEIADVCERHHVWLHVDGAHGASALLSERHCLRLRGLERADSLAWDPHKMMFQPLSTALVLVREGQWLRSAFQQEAPYLFQGSGDAGRPDALPDMGSYAFQCSRRADVIRLWIALEHYGTRRIGELYDHTCSLAEYLWQQLESSDDFETLHRPESNILCFRWRPAGVSESIPLNEAQDRLRALYMATGKGYIVTTTLPDGRRTLRVTLINPRTMPEHVDRMLAGLRRAAVQVRDSLD